MVSTMITRITMTIETMAPTAKADAPKLKGVGSATMLAVESPDALPLPTTKAPTVPITRPSRMASREVCGILLRTRTTRRVKPASAMLLGEA